MANKRAKTVEEKREVIVELFHIWNDGDHKYLRLGQLIGNIIRTEQELYNIEDFDLIEKLEKGYKDNGKNK